MKTLKQWLDARAAKAKELDDLTQAAKAESRDLSIEDGAKVDGIIEELRSIDENIVRARQLENEALVRSMANTPVHTGVAGNTDGSEPERREQRGFNLMRAIQLQADGKKLDGIEGEVAVEGVKSARANGIEVSSEAFYVPAQHMQKRGQTVTLQTTAPGDQGGVLVPTDVMPLLDAIWAQTWLDKVGARFLTGLTGNPRFPVQKTKPTISELTEIEEMGYTEILFSDFAMTPKRRGATIPISRQSILQASIDIQDLVIENISLALAQYLNVEALGIVLGAITAGNNNLLALGTNGAIPTYANLVDLEAMVETKDALKYSPRYLTNAKVKAILKKAQVFTGTTGEPVWGKGNILNDYPVVSSNLVPSNITKGTATNASAIIFGNFDDLYVGLWGGVEFIVDPFTAKRKAQVEITANTFYDIKVARPESFAGIKDALTA